MRLCYTGAVGRWGFALYLASSDRYEDSMLPTGSPTGTPADALDYACRLHLTAPGTCPDAGHNTPSPAVNSRRTSGTRGPLGYREWGPHCSVRLPLRAD